jgi:hypothetical protein
MILPLAVPSAEGQASNFLVAVAASRITTVFVERNARQKTGRTTKMTIATSTTQFWSRLSSGGFAAATETENVHHLFR